MAHILGDDINDEVEVKQLIVKSARQPAEFNTKKMHKNALKKKIVIRRWFSATHIRGDELEKILVGS